MSEAERIINEAFPYPDAWVAMCGPNLHRPRFICWARNDENDSLVIHDAYLFIESQVQHEVLSNAYTDLPQLYALAIQDAFFLTYTDDCLEGELLSLFDGVPWEPPETYDWPVIELNVVRVS